MIRKIFKKGESFDDYSQKDISLMMSHINSYSRKKLNNNKPIKIFNFLYGENYQKIFSNRFSKKFLLTFFQES